ncbi:MULTISPECIES: YHS domain-containing protein [Microbacterium]|uniref:YHS domain-containing protein n=1 Tax=Microbacterium sufflavum TaxID=2851649 RepID=A0ABY4IGS1_9MICO|nr:MULTISPECIES: YHS domain-containing protein [Microbacterium]UPL11789.1 YHS domain-containing protein [Microbacterium sufflavum]
MSDSPAGSCCSVPAAGGVAAEGRPDLLASNAEGMTTCPVMAGSPVVIAQAEAAGLFRDYEGTRYHFCCAGCGPAFDADPAKYIAAA